MEADPSARVVDLLRALEGDAAKWNQERDSLSAECARWSAPLTAPAAPGGSPAALPQRCRELLSEVSAQNRRAAAACRGAKVAEKHSLREQTARGEAERSAAEALRAAEARGRASGHRSEEAREQRQLLAAAQKRRLADREAQNSEEVAAIERRIEEIRLASDEYAKEGRRRCAEERRRATQGVDALQSTFGVQCEELEMDMERYFADCAKSMEHAAQRIAEAEQAAVEAWRQCHEHVETVHKEADEQVRLHAERKQAHLADVNMLLGDHEEALELELVSSAEREVALLTDREAEDRVNSAAVAMEEEVRRQREECGEFCRQGWLDAKRLFVEVEAEGARAAARVVEAQERADREVDVLIPQVLDKANHEGRILQLQAQLNATVLMARTDLTARLEHFQQSAAAQHRDAGAALISADRRVEELRSRTQAQTEQRLREAERAIRSLEDERKQVHGHAEEHLQRAREQMVKYIGSQQEELMSTLGSPDTAVLPLSVSLTQPLALEN
mmetsp:Transcript_178223/g.571287  ORF Transcript_178223/g.571287 Transcript_178223/m.571287 type:complete len:504 (+) Transcript_178223:126-1637(+)